VPPSGIGPARRPGTYLRCMVCGKLLNIEWAARSIVCSCGSRITPPQRDEKSG
jgi:DNA-directed RNA polymerase subunit RPC12/RpoP